MTWPVDALHDVERRADHATRRRRRRAPRARARGRRSAPQHARLAQDVVGAGRQRPARRAAQHELGAVAAHGVGDVRVALADRLDLEARRRPSPCASRKASSGSRTSSGSRSFASPSAWVRTMSSGATGCSPRETLVLPWRARRQRPICTGPQPLGSPGGSWCGADPHATFLNSHRHGVRPGRAARPGRRAGVAFAVADLRGAARPQGPRDTRRRPSATSRRSACTRCASSSTGTTSRRSPTRASSPSFDATDPAGYDWSAYDPVIDGDQGARLAGAADRLGSGPAVGHQRRTRHRDAAQPGRVPEVRARRRPPLRHQGRHVERLERAQPAAVPAAAVLAAQDAAVAGRSTASSTSPPSAAWPTRAWPRRRGADGGDLAARHRQGRRAADLPARRAVPGLQVPQDAQSLREAAGRRLRPPRLHDGAGPDLQAHASPTTSPSACSRG